jgi:hypothetical protein
VAKIIYTCARCDVDHYTINGVTVVDNKFLCRNTSQCTRRIGPEFTASKAIKLSVGDEVVRLLLPRGSRAVYTTPGGLLFCIGIRPPSYPVGVTWLKYTVQRHVRKPKVLWCGVTATTIKLFFA